MSLFRKLFGTKASDGNERLPESSNEKQVGKRPDNARLTYLLNQYGQNASRENYEAVVHELTEGDCCLFLPTVNNGSEPAGWRTTETSETLSLLTVFNMDGLMVLGAFSSKSAMETYMQQITTYTAMQAGSVIALCNTNGIDRIVIDSRQPTMFVLERSRGHIEQRTLEKETPMMLGPAAKPLDKSILDNLAVAFQKVDPIIEAYHYGVSMNNKFSLMIGVCMSKETLSGTAAMELAVSDTIASVPLKFPLDVIILKEPGLLNAVRNIPDALFYKRKSEQ